MTTTADSGREPRGDWFGWLVLVAVLLRIFVGSSILNLFVPYDIPGGSALVKITPGTYLLILAALIGLARRPVRDEQTIASGFVLCTAATICAALVALVGNTVASGFLIDTIVSGGCAAIALSRLTQSERRRVLLALLVALFINGLIILAEFALKARVLPYPYREVAFRPTALLSHPLNNGLFYVAAVPIMLLAPGALWLRGLVSIFFVAVIFASGARTASLLSVAAFAAAMPFAIMRQRARTETDHFIVIGQGLALISLSVIAAAVALSSGLGYRFATSIIDDSSKARISAYTLLRHLSEPELLWGAGSQKMTYFAKASLNMTSVESPIVAFVFGFGVPLTILLMSAIAYTVFARASRREIIVNIAALSFFAVAISNNALSSKNACLVVIVTIVSGGVSLNNKSSVKSAIRPRGH